MAGPSDIKWLLWRVSSEEQGRREHPTVWGRVAKGGGSRPREHYHIYHQTVTFILNADSYMSFRNVAVSLIYHHSITFYHHMCVYQYRR